MRKMKKMRKIKCYQQFFRLLTTSTVRGGAWHDGKRQMSQRS